MKHSDIGRWVAWQPDGDPLEINELPYFGAVVGSTFYHGGGSSFMDFPSDCVVLADFGRMTVEEAVDTDIDSAFWRQFPPESGTVADLARLASGWLAPTGTLYPCPYSAHRLLAKRIIAHGLAPEVRGEYEGRLGSEPEDWLLRCRWVRLSPHVVLWDEQLTKKQNRVLLDVVDVSTDHRMSQRLVAECKRAMRIYSLTGGEP